MLTQIAEGVLTHQSEFMQSNAVIVHGAAGVLLVDAGITADELSGIANELVERGLDVAAGFSTHPHWDHLLWHPAFGDVPRYGTARAAAVIQSRLADPEWPAMVAGMMPPELVGRVPLDGTFGRITGLPEGAHHVDWDGPAVRVVEHTGHAPGHAALLIESAGVLVAGDMLSDVLVPILNGMSPDPVGDYLVSLQLLEDAAAAATLVIPGHGSIGDAADLAERIALDRAYVTALRDGGTVDDPRLGASATPGWEWVQSLHDGQVERLRAL